MRNYSKRRFRRRKKSLWRRRWFWDIVLGFAFVISLSYLLFFSPAFKVRDYIGFVPSKNMSDYMFIIELFETQRNKPMLLIRSSLLEAEILEKVPEIEGFQVRKKLPGDLLLTYKMREPALVLCNSVNSNDCCLIDESAKLFACGNTFEWWDKKDLAVVFSNKSLITQDEINKIVKIQQWAEKNDIFDIDKFILLSQQQLNVLTIQGWEMYFNLSDDINLVLTKLKLLLEQEISQDKRKNLEYIDLRFSKVYYK